MRIPLLLLPTLLLLGACGGDDLGPLPPVAREQANAIVIVSNQSLVLPVVPVTVRIDGRLAAHGEFPVDSGSGLAPGHVHVWHPVRLEAGHHEVTATSDAAPEDLELAFDLPEGGKRWIAVTFWKGEGDQVGRLHGVVRDEPIKGE